MSFYSFAKGFLNVVIAKTLFPTKVIKNDVEIPEGPLVVCANHLSAVDVLLLIASFDRPVCFMGKKELFKIPVLRQVMEAVGAFPVNRSGMDVSAVKKGIGLLNEGKAMGIFPQGTRCPGVHPRETKDKLRNGAVMMGSRAKAALMPVAVKTKGYKVRPFKRVTLIYGKAIPFDEYKDMADGKDFSALTDMLFENICALHGESSAKDA